MAVVEGFCHLAFESVRSLLLDQLRGNHDWPAECGAAVCVVIDGVEVINLWCGYADALGSRPWQQDTLVCVYSVTKAWTALGAHVLCSKGDLDIDAPVAHYWPEFAAAGKEGITVRHLLCHQSGLQCLHVPIFHLEELSDWERITDSLAAESPEWDPGSKSAYHPFTFGHLVGEVVRRADARGRTLGKLLLEDVFSPLGLQDEMMLGGAVPPEQCAEVTWAGDNSSDPWLYRGGRESFATVVADLSAQVKAGSAHAAERLMDINPQRPCSTLNLPEFRAAGLPAGGGHATAHGLATFYAMLADGRAVMCGFLDQDALMNSTAIAWCTDVAGQLRGGGFKLCMHGRPRTFGHSGRGGQDAFGDHDEKLGFAYLHNRLSNAPEDGERPCASQVADLVYECLPAYKLDLAAMI